MKTADAPVLTAPRDTRARCSGASTSDLTQKWPFSRTQLEPGVGHLFMPEVRFERKASERQDERS